MANKGLEAWGDAQHEILERLWRNGSMAALIEALYISQRCRIPLPGWTSKAIHTVLDELVRGNLQGRMGRHSAWFKQYTQDMIDFERYELIMKLREEGVKWKDVYQTASDLLEGADSAGKAGTMKAAYKRFKRRERSSPWRYHVFSIYRPAGAHERPVTETYLKLIEDVQRFDNR